MTGIFEEILQEIERGESAPPDGTDVRVCDECRYDHHGAGRHRTLDGNHIGGTVRDPNPRTNAGVIHPRALCLINEALSYLHTSLEEGNGLTELSSPTQRAYLHTSL
jgi:hypothetical protein